MSTMSRLHQDITEVIEECTEQIIEDIYDTRFNISGECLQQIGLKAFELGLTFANNKVISTVNPN